jgi:threonine dehydrogenase-like Zn-dependent dehydrogenase
MSAPSVVAAVKSGPETTELREFPLPELPDDGGLLRVEACGVGGSDPEQYRRATRFPCIMGHEIVGTIERLGPKAAARWRLKPGDRVALEEYLPCWRCKWCMQGDFRLCMEVDFFVVKDPLRYGMGELTIPPSLWGGYGQYVYLPPNAVMHRLPQDLSPRLATLAIPFGNGVQWACMDGGAGPGKTVLVFGPGQQGLGCVLAAKAGGAFHVILAGMTRDRERLALAKRLGADSTIDIEQQDLRATVMELTGGYGVDVVVDTTGDPTGDIAAHAIALAAKGAYLSLNGLSQTVSVGDIKKKYLTVRAPRGHSFGSIELALRYIASHRWPLDEVCSHDFALADTHTAILATAGREVRDAIHVTVDPWR